MRAPSPHHEVRAWQLPTLFLAWTSERHGPPHGRRHWPRSCLPELRPSGQGSWLPGAPVLRRHRRPSPLAREQQHQLTGSQPPLQPPSPSMSRRSPPSASPSIIRHKPRAPINYTERSVPSHQFASGIAAMIEERGPRGRIRLVRTSTILCKGLWRCVRVTSPSPVGVVDIVLSCRLPPMRRLVSLPAMAFPCDYW